MCFRQSTAGEEQRAYRLCIFRNYFMNEEGSIFNIFRIGEASPTLP